MSEVEARAPTRGRSSARGGRGGFGRGGPRGGRKQVNGTSHDASTMDDSLEDEGELGEMKKKYSAELGMLKDMFPDWTDIDLVFALEESAGDVPAAVDHITQGNVSQFAEVKKPKDRARSKANEPSTAGAADKPAFSARGGRGRGGFEGARGRGGRGSDRGRGGMRGGRGGHATTNGAPKDAGITSVPTTESSAWDTPQAAAETGTSAWDSTTTAAPAASARDATTTDAPKESTEAGQSAWGNVVSSEATPATASEGAKSTLIPEGGAKKSWASMFAQPKPAPVAVPKPAQQAQPKAQPPPAELVASGQIPKSEETPSVPETKEPESVAETPAPVPEAQATPVETPSGQSDLPVPTPSSATAGQEADLTPAHDPLTKENVEHLPDESHPPDTFTAASTTDSQDPRNLTPMPGQQPPIGRPPLGGFATSAQRAANAATAARSASYQRRVQEQQEAVVMPGHNAVDRAAVQFGSMGLNGEPGMDVDEEREEPETRHAPQHSPPSQPKTSLPPAPRQTVTAQEPLPPSQPEGLPTPKQAPGLPPASQQNQQQIQESALGQGLPQEPAQAAPGFNQYGGYGQGSLQDSAAQQQKAYDPFSHQAAYDRFGTQPPTQSGFGALSSAPNDYSSYYTADPQRSAYGGYYGGSAGYGPQDTRTQAQQQQDVGLGQQRSASGFGAGLTDTAFGSQAQQQVGNLASLPTLYRKVQDSEDENERKDLQMKIERLLASQTVSAQSASRKTSSTQAGHPAPVSTSSGIPALGDANNSHFSPFVSPNPKVYLSNVSSKQTQSRYGEAPGSGHNTPNPLMGGIGQQQQQQAAPSSQQSQHPMHQAPSHQQQSAYGGYPYGHPYYSSPYQQAYQNQFGYGQQVGGYGGYPSKQGGMYGAPQGYGSSYDQHSASPANAGAFGQNQQASMRSASGMGSALGGGSSLDDYGRSSAQPASHNQSGGFNGMNDPFARSTSGFGGQAAYGQQQQGMTGGSQDDSLKPFTDSKSGPSPALGQPGRPGSATNSVGGSTQAGMPQQQSHQSAFGGYGSFPGQGSQYGGLGGLGSQQQGGQQGGYGGQGYGGYSAGFGQTYGGYGGSRGGGGWGQSYGGH